MDNATQWNSGKVKGASLKLGFVSWHLKYFLSKIIWRVNEDMPCYYNFYVPSNRGTFSRYPDHHWVASSMIYAFGLTSRLDWCLHPNANFFYDYYLMISSSNTPQTSHAWIVSHCFCSRRYVALQPSRHNENRRVHKKLLLRHEMRLARRDFNSSTLTFNCFNQILCACQYSCNKEKYSSLFWALNLTPSWHSEHQESDEWTSSLFFLTGGLGLVDYGIRWVNRLTLFSYRRTWVGWLWNKMNEPAHSFFLPANLSWLTME